MFGEPDAITIAELVRLPNLKSLSIVYTSGDENLTKPDFVAKLQAQLQGVEVTVVAARDFRRTLPQSFVDHLKRTQEELARKYWGSDK
jgi:hypothetical protein